MAVITHSSSNIFTDWIKADKQTLYSNVSYQIYLSISDKDCSICVPGQVLELNDISWK